jgi:hypothetical protein
MPETVPVGSHLRPEAHVVHQEPRRDAGAVDDAAIEAPVHEEKSKLMILVRKWLGKTETNRSGFRACDFAEIYNRLEHWFRSASGSCWDAGASFCVLMEIITALRVVW